MSTNDDFFRWDRVPFDDIFQLQGNIENEPVQHEPQPPQDPIKTPPLIRGAPKLPSLHKIPMLQNFVGKNYFDCSAVVPAQSQLKSRMACVSFPPARFDVSTQESRSALLNDILSTLVRAHQSVYGGFGMSIRYGTFFTVQDATWFVLVNNCAQPFSKWHKVFRGLDAAEIKVFYSKTDRHRTQNSISSVMEMFPSATMQELVNNQRMPDVSELQLQTSGLQLQPRRRPAHDSASPPSQGKKRRRPIPPSPKPALVEMPVVASSTAKRNISWDKLFSPEPLTAPPCETQHAPSLSWDQMLILNQPAASVPVSSSFDDLARACAQFLASDSLDTCSQHEANLRRYLEVPNHRGQMGLFLLDGRLNELYAQACYLKEFVYSILKERFEMSPATLGTTDVTNELLYPGMDEDTQQNLGLVCRCVDTLAAHITFALHDRVSVLVFLSLHVLRRHREHRSRPDTTNFMSSEALILGEVRALFHMPRHTPSHHRAQIPYAYSKMVYELQSFLRHQTNIGYFDLQSAAAWLPEQGSSHMSILSDFAQNMPQEFLVRNPPARDRHAFRVNKFAVLVRYECVQYAHDTEL